MNNVAVATSATFPADTLRRVADSAATTANRIERPAAARAAAIVSAALAALAGAPTPQAMGGSAASNTALAALLTQILQRAANSPQTPPAAAAGIILNQLLNPGSDAARMDLNLNQLLNNSTLQNLLRQLPPELLARPQVFEALVLQNTLLPANTPTDVKTALPLLILPGTPPTAPGAPAAQLPATLYRVNVQWQNRLLQLLSPQPLPGGSRVQLAINPQGQIVLLAPTAAATGSTSPAIPGGALPAPSAPPPPGLPLSVRPPPVTVATAAPAAAQNALPAAGAPAQHTIQQALRELLPRQQALHTLVPLLQKFIQPALRAQLPAPVFKALAQLLQSLPKPAQLQNVEGLKQSLNNSGSFLEARVARALLPAAATPEALPKIFATDLKGQISALLQIIRKFAPELPPSAHAPMADGDDGMVYGLKPAGHINPSTAPAVQAHADNDSVDALLGQLNKLLQSGLARIQLNQLDGVAARHTPDTTQAPVPTWLLELPLRTPHGIDQLQLRIEQRRQKVAQRTRVQWNVQISFDLHSAGKLAATLAIIDKTVSATLWAERAHTHRTVRAEMDYLRAGLESVGVRVTEMQCRLGLPAPRSHPISQQLVDLHT